jgi:hypothetical protein
MDADNLGHLQVDNRVRSLLSPWPGVQTMSLIKNRMAPPPSALTGASEASRDVANLRRILPEMLHEAQEHRRWREDFGGWEGRRIALPEVAPDGHQYEAVVEEDGRTFLLRKDTGEAALSFDWATGELWNPGGCAVESLDPACNAMPEALIPRLDLDLLS